MASQRENCSAFFRSYCLKTVLLFLFFLGWSLSLLSPILFPEAYRTEVRTLAFLKARRCAFSWMDVRKCCREIRGTSGGMFILVQRWKRSDWEQLQIPQPRRAATTSIGLIRTYLRGLLLESGASSVVTKRQASERHRSKALMLQTECKSIVSLRTQRISHCLTHRLIARTMHCPRHDTVLGSEGT